MVNVIGMVHTVAKLRIFTVRSFSCFVVGASAADSRARITPESFPECAGYAMRSGFSGIPLLVFGIKSVLSTESHFSWVSLYRLQVVCEWLEKGV